MKIIMGGITGKTGRAVAGALLAHPDMELVAAVGKRCVGQDLGEVLGMEPMGRLVYPDVEAALCEHEADVYVDFTNPEAVESNAGVAVAKGLDLVIGTTGMRKDFVEELASQVSEKGSLAVIASNFSLGVVALSQGARMLRDHYGAQHVQIIETHHESKKDMPSGTALYLQQLIGNNQGETAEIHSLRVPKRTSKHRIMVHIQGETISLEHEVTNPDAFGAGVLYVLEHGNGQKGCFLDLASFVEMTEKVKVG